MYYTFCGFIPQSFYQMFFTKPLVVRGLVFWHAICIIFNAKLCRGATYANGRRELCIYCTAFSIKRLKDISLLLF